MIISCEHPFFVKNTSKNHLFLALPPHLLRRNIRVLLHRMKQQQTDLINRGIRLRIRHFKRGTLMKRERHRNHLAQQHLAQHRPALHSTIRSNSTSSGTCTAGSRHVSQSFRKQARHVFATSIDEPAAMPSRSRRRYCAKKGALAAERSTSGALEMTVSKKP